jgi:hypothetical protein
LGLSRFEQLVRREIVKRGGHKTCGRIARKLFAALGDPAGVLAHRRGGLERVQLLLADWVEDQRRLVDTEARMLSVLDELHLTELVTSIDGVSPVGAAAILAETGDPRRFTTVRVLVKHAGLAPREKLSGSYVGRTKLTGQGRPGLRLAAWRVVWAVLHTNAVYAARYRHLASREKNKLTPTQAQSVIAAAVLRQLHAVIVTGNAWDPAIARHGTQKKTDRPRRLTIRRGGQADGRGEPHAALRHPVISPDIMGSLARRHTNPDYTLPGPTPLQLCRGQTTDEAPTRSLTKTTYADDRMFAHAHGYMTRLLASASSRSARKSQASSSLSNHRSPVRLPRSP